MDRFESYLGGKFIGFGDGLDMGVEGGVIDSDVSY